MGVPKFYRWISERYPCLSQVVKEHQIPEFDNLYLDMNGIIHQCSHPNDDDPHFRITEEQIFSDIFHYIEVLFRIIKPRKTFFMAVDGVAPRAKMNQQRGRRFRSAKEAELNILKALEKGQTLPKEERFDSNCITPGTYFMVRLQEQLQYFVNRKISTDSSWQGVKVYLSGHETPGEGEHKVMDFIRYLKLQPDYDANTRHCLYGLDADLMMLGLSSHEPHFSLLREEVSFGKRNQSKKILKPEEITFHLLHLSVMREYIEFEFIALKGNLKFEYDLERIIDDWVLMGFLVGNDFVPHLPNLHINHDALPLLYKTYHEVLPQLDGYLHDGGELNLQRFEVFLQCLSKHDKEKFEDVFVDFKWMESKTGQHPLHGSKDIRKEFQATASKDLVTTSNSFTPLENLAQKFEEFKVDEHPLKLLENIPKEYEPDNEEEMFEIEFKLWKENYYNEKLNLELFDRAVVDEMALHYMHAVQWILLYYFHGVPSWGWFYPYHYAPFISDITNVGEMKLSYDRGKAFLPFEQLLAVLPSASKKLLPDTLQSLMIMDNSPIIDYYPPNFSTDMNGKQQEWEAVVLIPFIDEKRLLDAMVEIYPQMTDEEKLRNRHGPHLLFTYDSKQNTTHPSPLPGVFPDITCCHAVCEKLPFGVFRVDPKKRVKGLSEGVKLDVYYPGFPTMKHIPHTAELKKCGVKVFQMNSRGENMLLHINNSSVIDLEAVAHDLLNQSCYVGWPHMVEALVLSVSDGFRRYSVKSVSKNKEMVDMKEEVLDKRSQEAWKSRVRSAAAENMERKGIDVGSTHILVEASTIQGKKYICGSKGIVTLEKQWQTIAAFFPLQATVKDISVHCSEAVNKIETLEQLFPISCQCFMIVSPHYGSQGEVIDVDSDQGRVRVQLTVEKSPDLTDVISNQKNLSDVYMPEYIIARKLGIDSWIVSRIGSKFLVEKGSSTAAKSDERIDIGLNLKFSKRNKEVLGYARRTENGWTYSPSTLKIFQDYVKKFAMLFSRLARLQRSVDRVFAADLVPEESEFQLSDVRDWLKTLPSHKSEAVTCGSKILDDKVVSAIEEKVEENKNSNSSKLVKVRVKPYCLYRFLPELGNCEPDSEADFMLFDRVINIKSAGTVPFGLKGTIIGIHPGEDGDTEIYEVLFDEPFLAGQKLRCSEPKGYCMMASAMINISFGKRQEAKRKTPVQTKPLNHVSFSAAAKQNLPYDNRRQPDSAPPNMGPRFHMRAANMSTDSRNGGSSPKGGSNGKTSSQSPGNPPIRIARRLDYSQDLAQAAQTPQTSRSPPQQHNSETEFANMWKELQRKEKTKNGKSRPKSAQKSKSTPSQSENTTPQPISLVKTSKSSSNTTPQRDQPISLVPANKGTPQTTPQTSHEKQPTRQKSGKKHENGSNDRKEWVKLENVGAEDKSPESVAKESTEMLRDLLQIGRVEENTSPQSSTSSPNSTNNPTPPPSLSPGQSQFGQQVNLNQLFNSPPQGQPQVQMKASPLPAGISPSGFLTNICRGMQMPPPHYVFIQNPQGGVVSVVQLGNGVQIPGGASRGRAEAVESAAACALHQMSYMPVMSPYQPQPASPHQPRMNPSPQQPGREAPTKPLSASSNPFVPLQVSLRNPNTAKTPTKSPQQQTSPPSKETTKDTESKRSPDTQSVSLDVAAQQLKQQQIAAQQQQQLAQQMAQQKMIAQKQQQQQMMAQIQQQQEILARKLQLAQQQQLQIQQQQQLVSHQQSPDVQKQLQQVMTQNQLQQQMLVQQQQVLAQQQQQLVMSVPQPQNAQNQLQQMMVQAQNQQQQQQQQQLQSQQQQQQILAQLQSQKEQQMKAQAQAQLQQQMLAQQQQIFAHRQQQQQQQLQSQQQQQAVSIQQPQSIQNQLQQVMGQAQSQQQQQQQENMPSEQLQSTCPTQDQEVVLQAASQSSASPAVTPTKPQRLLAPSFFSKPQ